MIRIVAVLLALFLITGCNSQSNDQGGEDEKDDINTNSEESEDINTNNDENEIPPSDNEENQQTDELEEVGTNLNELVLSEIDRTKYYQGYAEYGHYERLVEMESTDKETIYVFAGTMTDGRGLTDEEGNPLAFERTVTVTDEWIKSELTSENLDLVATSLFQEKILLKKPLEVGQSWSESVEYEGETYDAVSTIVTIGLDNSNQYYDVETIIENIEGFPNNTYKERIRIAERKGVVSFENTMKNLTDPLTEDGYTFGYGIAIIE